MAEYKIKLPRKEFFKFPVKIGVDGFPKTLLQVITLAELKTYNAIGSYANIETGECFASLETLAVFAGLNRKSFQSAVKNLNEFNLISIKKREGETTIYVIKKNPTIRIPQKRFDAKFRRSAELKKHIKKYRKTSKLKNSKKSKQILGVTQVVALHEKKPGTQVVALPNHQKNAEPRLSNNLGTQVVAQPRTQVVAQPTKKKKEKEELKKKKKTHNIPHSSNKKQRQKFTTEKPKPADQKTIGEKQNA